MAKQFVRNKWYFVRRTMAGYTEIYSGPFDTLKKAVCSDWPDVYGVEVMQGYGLVGRVIVDKRSADVRSR